MKACKTDKCECIKNNSNNFDNKMIETDATEDLDTEDYIHYPIFDEITKDKCAYINENDIDNNLTIFENNKISVDSKNQTFIPIKSFSIGKDEPINFDNFKLRSFDGGAIRDTNIGKLEYYGFLSPLVLKRYSEYMNKHRTLPDGSLRGSDNWKNLFGKDHNKICFDSLLRHLMDVWLIMDGYSDEAREPLEEALCAMSFNINALLLKILKDKKQDKPEGI